jgi:hypothetical protein
MELFLLVVGLACADVKIGIAIARVGDPVSAASYAMAASRRSSGMVAMVVKLSATA